MFAFGLSIVSDSTSALALQSGFASVSEFGLRFVTGSALSFDSLSRFAYQIESASCSVTTFGSPFEFDSRSASGSAFDWWTVFDSKFASDSVFDC
jgi:hypothetical protein